MIEKRRAKRLLYLFGIPSGLVLIFAFGFNNYLVVNRPTFPDPSHGNTHAIAAHGPPVYVSSGDLIVLCSAAAVGVIGLAIAYYFQSRAN